MMEKASFKKGFGGVLKTAGFLSKGQSWFKDGRDSIVVLNLQKSDFDEKYYVNFGVWLKSLGMTTFPSDTKCHIQGRLTSLFPAQSVMIDRGCMLTSGAEAFATLLEFMAEKVVPFCEDCLKIESLQAKVVRGEFKKALIMKSAKEVLAIAESGGALG
jgi:hypothetical protein